MHHPAIESMLTPQTRAIVVINPNNPSGAVYDRDTLAQIVVLAEKHNLIDQVFALELLEGKDVLVAPGSSFNTPYNDHFRITTLPDPDVIFDVFARIESLLEQHA